MVTWNQACKWFEIDGALRDIVVRDAVEADWDELFALVAEAGYSANWSVLGQPVAAPENAADYLADPEPPLLSFVVGAVRVNLHCFGVDEIELDVDPREIQSESAFGHVLELMRDAGRRLGKPVHMSCESDHDRPFLVFDPQTEAFSQHDAW